MSRHLCVVLLVGSMWAGGVHSSPAHAQPALPVPADDETRTVQRVEVLSAEGITLYQEGRYEEALVRFQAALAIRPVGNLLFNIARTMERLGRPDEAVVYYERFVAAPDASADGIAKARARVLALRGAPKPAPVRPPSDLGREAEGGVVGASTHEEPSGASAIELAGWIALGTGLAGLTAGATLAALSSAEEGSFSDAETLADKATHRSRAEDFAVGADVAFAVGGAAAATGLGLLIAHWAGGSDSSPTVSMVPNGAGRGATLGIVGRF